MYTGHKWSMWSVTQKFLKFYYKVRWAYYIFVGNQHENNHVYMYITYIIYIYIYIYIYNNYFWTWFFNKHNCNSFTKRVQLEELVLYWSEIPDTKYLYNNKNICNIKNNWTQILGLMPWVYMCNLFML